MYWNDAFPVIDDIMTQYTFPNFLRLLTEFNKIDLLFTFNMLEIQVDNDGNWIEYHLLGINDCLKRGMNGIHIFVGHVSVKQHGKTHEGLFWDCILNDIEVRFDQDGTFLEMFVKKVTMYNDISKPVAGENQLCDLVVGENRTIRHWSRLKISNPKIDGFSTVPVHYKVDPFSSQIWMDSQEELEFLCQQT